jgi:hypothetical protein
MVLCQKALCLPNLYHGEEGSELIMYNVSTTSRTQRPAQAALFLTLVQKLYNNSHLNKNVFNLDGGRRYLRSGKEGVLVEECQQLIRKFHTRRLTTCVLTNT